VIAGSDAAADRLRSRGFDGQITVAPQSGVDTEQFTPAFAKQSDGLDADSIERLPSAFDADDDEQIVLYAGRLDPEKGIETLLETVPAVRKSVPSVRYILLGEGSLEDDLRTTVDFKGLNGTVDLITERQPYDLMPVIYRTADTFVYPSETTDNWAEQFGYSVAEAMSCGVVPVVSDCGSLPWVVGDAGVVVPEADPDALADGITYALTAADQQRLSARARERVVTNFSLNSVAEAQLTFLRSVIDDTS
jgi:glycosyltransferase involved in cell wall biosynthesis